MAAGPAFVAGATGYTGREVVRALRARGVPTYAHVRPDSPRVAEWTSRFAATGARADATAWDEGAMAETLRRIQPAMVFALLGTTRARGRAAASSARGEARGPSDAETYEAVDYGLTALLLRASVAAGSRPRFVYLSSIGVRDGARSAYLAARAKLETELRASGLPFTIARPSLISGPDRDEPRIAERGAAIVADRLLRVVAALGGRDVADRYRSISGTELAAALVAAALDPARENRVLDGAQLQELARRAAHTG